MQPLLREHMDRWYGRQNLWARIDADPIAFPRRYQAPEDREVAALIAASLAYGNVKAFGAVVEQLLALAGPSPAVFVREFDPARARPSFRRLYYRFSDADDLRAFFFILRELTAPHGSLRALFASLHRPEDADIGPLLCRYVEAALAVDARAVYGKQAGGHGRKPAGLRHLFSGPGQGGASKRLCMFLRWMVRPDDGVDLGLWPMIPPSKLIMPLDAHIVRLSRHLGLTRRKSAGWLMAQEVTANLRTICPDDPVKYDFALCHYGMSGACPATPVTAQCARCDLQTVCRVGRRRTRRCPAADVTLRPLEA